MRSFFLRSSMLLLFGSFILLGKTNAQHYDRAIGIRAAWGVGASYKHFIKDNSAIEGILNYRRFGASNVHWSYTQLSGLYQIHDELSPSVEGLSWYYGFGAFIGFWGGTFADRIDGDMTYMGILGNLGLDYAFRDVPINISLDWVPGIALVGGGGFLGELGGISVRYIF